MDTQLTINDTRFMTMDSDFARFYRFFFVWHVWHFNCVWCLALKTWRRVFVNFWTLINVSNLVAAFLCVIPRRGPFGARGGGAAFKYGRPERGYIRYFCPWEWVDVHAKLNLPELRAQTSNCSRQISIPACKMMWRKKALFRCITVY